MSNPSVVLNKPGEIVFRNKPIPKITDEHYVKVAIKKTGICGSDVHFFVHGSIGDFVVKNPMVLGHESAGIIVETGKLVKNIKVGDRVALEPGIPSRYSEEYKSGHYNLCPHMHFAATPPFDGTLARYYLAPEDFVYKLPENVSLEEGALVEPLSVAVHACKLAGIRFNSKVAVFGAGPVGLLAAGVASAFGASEVIVLDIFDDKLELAKQIGATTVFNSLKSKPGSFVNDLLEIVKERPDVIIEASGAEIAINNGIKLVKSGGSFVQVGMGKDVVKFPVADVISKEVTFHGNFRYCHGDYKDAIDLIATGKVNAKLVISHRYKFKDAIKAYENNAYNPKGIIKAMIDGPEDLSKL